jgi:hypothetical protein
MAVGAQYPLRPQLYFSRPFLDDKASPDLRYWSDDLISGLLAFLGEQFGQQYKRVDHRR